MNNLKWWQKTALYQIYPKSFADTTGSGTGDIQGIINHLDYIKSLGIGAIWLTPIYPSPQVDNGYDIADYTAIDPRYGTMADFERLIAEADKRNIKIIMDLVYNHSSNQHKWFLESKSSRNNPKSDWYIWRDAKPDGSAPTNWRGIVGGSAWTWCEERQQYYLHTFAVEQPDLNWENPEVRQALFDASNFWLDKGVGGFRIDAIVYIKKPKEFVDGEPDATDGTSSIHTAIANTPGILDFLYEFRKKVFDGHDIFTVAEANSVQPEELKYWVGEHGAFDMLIEFNHTNVMFPNGEVWHSWEPWKLTQLKKALTESQKATMQNGWYPIYFENHDKPRCIDIFMPEGADPIKASKAMATIVFTLRGMPFIYEGQELGYRNVDWPSIDCYNDISSIDQYKWALRDGYSEAEALKFVHRFSRDNARTPMQWTNGVNAGFSTGKPWLPVHDDYDKCNADVEDRDKNSVLNYYRKLNDFRQHSEALLSGDYEELLKDDERIYAFSRSTKNSKIYVLVNFTLDEVKFSAEFLQSAKFIFGNYEAGDKGVLRPTEAVIYKEEI